MNKLSVPSLQAFDFSTLYTNIDQSEILEHLYVVCRLFNNSNRKFLCIRFDKAFFASKTHNYYDCFDLRLFEKAIHFVVNKVYIVFSGHVFKQTKRIPMGGNCSPL